MSREVQTRVRSLAAAGGGALLAGLAVLVGLPGPLASQDASFMGAAVAASCGVEVDPATEAVVAGVVTDSVSGVPLPGALVTLGWSPSGGGAGESVETRSDGEGFFAFCKVPAGIRVTLQAVLRESSPRSEVDVEAGMVHVEPLRIRLSDPDSRGILVGRIVDAELRRPVADAVVRLVEADVATTSNGRGYFAFGDQRWGIYTLQVASLGYDTVTTGVRVAGNLTQNIEVLLSPDALELEGITVTADARARRQIEGLVRRMNLGAGDFITRETIERRPAAGVADFLREVPGVAIRHGLYGRLDMEVRGRTCTPTVFVDGVLYALDPDSGLDFYAGELEAIEVYKGVQVPGEFLRAGQTRFPCAVIAVWTRRGYVPWGGRSGGTRP